MSDFNSFENSFFDRRQAIRPTARTYTKHFLILLITFCTVTVAGVIQPFGTLTPFADVPADATAFEFVRDLPFYYFKMISEAVYLLYSDPKVLKYGLSFSISLLFILISHEMGHYVACRIYSVDATLPFFIPTPPLLGPAGTFGAFIKILSPLPSRRATFDIGVAGPIAGFVAMIPIAVIFFLTHQYDSSAPLPLSDNISGVIVFSDPLFFKILAAIFGTNLDLSMKPNPFYGAAWIGLLVTALNLIPSGQLDGGHAIFAVFGERFHYWTGRIAFVVMVLLSAAGLYFFNSPSGILFAVLLGFMMKIRHPAPLDDTPLDSKRIVFAILTLLIFILCFTPFPIRVY